MAPRAIVNALQHFPQLTVLNLSQLSLPDQLVEPLCRVLRNNLRQLKVNHSRG